MITVCDVAHIPQYMTITVWWRVSWSHCVKLYHHKSNICLKIAYLMQSFMFKSVTIVIFYKQQGDMPAPRWKLYSWFTISDQYLAFCADIFFGFSSRFTASAVTCFWKTSSVISSMVAYMLTVRSHWHAADINWNSCYLVNGRVKKGYCPTPHITDFFRINFFSKVSK